ncbi:hypothetical protein ONZ43_g1361 [Nemania bipapillata]|uniref:Uncharacterized protein n=1 Tax=Nemania bipapillata TaxID=110536 RepID=A0ACC2J4N8_9PEZI|nr:hypothetical protein ONZ43_g1361 [Nemania bipapillata]
MSIHSFSSSEIWERHIRDTHKEEFPSEQLSSLASLSRKLLLLPIACPLCGYEERVEAKTLDHIAAHLHDFALRSLPWDSLSREGGGSYDLSPGLDDTKQAHHGHTRHTHSVETGKSVDEEVYTARGLEVLHGAIESILVTLPSVQKSGFNEFNLIQDHITSLQQKDFSGMADEDMDAYTRPLLRIQQIINWLSEADDLLASSPEQVEELKQSLLEEHVSLLKLGSKNEAGPLASNSEMPSQKTKSAPQYSQWFMDPNLVNAVEECRKIRVDFNKSLEKWIPMLSGFPEQQAAAKRLEAAPQFTAEEVENQLKEAGKQRTDEKPRHWEKAFHGFSQRVRDQRSFLSLLAEMDLVSSMFKAFGFMMIVLTCIDEIHEGDYRTIDIVQEVVSNIVQQKYQEVKLESTPPGLSAIESNAEHFESIKDTMRKVTEFRSFTEETQKQLNWARELGEMQRLIATDIWVAFERDMRDNWRGKLERNILNATGKAQIAGLVNHFANISAQVLTEHEKIIRFGTLTWDETRKFKAFICHRKLRDFLHDTRLRSHYPVLLVNGAWHGRSKPLVYASGVSSAIAHIVHELRVAPNVITVTFFCDFHGHRVGGKPRDIMVHLIAQLIRNRPHVEEWDLEVLQQYHNKVANAGIHELRLYIVCE